MPDEPRPVATSPDSQYSLTIEDAAALYARAGHPRTLRTVQRYCASGHIECVKAATMLGDKYYVEPSSVSRHIAQIEELMAFDRRTHGPGLSRQVAPTEIMFPSGDRPRQHATPPPVSAPAAASVSHEQGTRDEYNRATLEPVHSRPPATPDVAVSRPDATEDGDASRHVAQLEKEVGRLAEDRDFLRGQIKTKDGQIAALLERDRETNILVRGLQQMLSPLLGGPRPQSDQNREQHNPF